MKTSRNIPKFRFDGFTDAWEQRKLGELSEIIGGGTPSTQNPEYWDGEINWYAPAEIGESTYVKSSKRRITKLGLEKSSAKLLPVGTVLFTSRAGIGNTAILKTEGTTNQGFQSIVPIIGKLDSYFIYSRTKELKQYAEKVGAGSTFVEVSRKQMSEAPFLFPQVSEQKSIGSFFSTLDHLITLQQRELDYLKETKKTMLSELFPKKSETIPGVRFDGFTDAWEQRKLKEMIQKEVKGRAKSSMSGTKSIYLDTEYLNGGSKTYVDSATDVQETDILILWDGSQAGTVYYGFSGALGSTLKAFHPVESGRFIFDQLKAKETVIFERYRTPNIPHVIKSFTEEFELFRTIPSEQQSIGSFFSSLDHLITLQQRKLDLLKSQKQTLLKSMFPR